MPKLLNVTFFIFATLTLLACEMPDSEVVNEAIDPVLRPEVVELPTKQPLITDKSEQATLSESSFKTIEWTELMPKEDLEILLNPPSYINDIEDGSFEDQISSQVANALAAASDDPYQQALSSTRIVQEMDGQAIRIPGFIVPLEFDDEQTITQFFLVPFFGACIHVPPPPPNQIIFVNYPKGLKVEALYDPFWVSGIVKTSLVENEMATAAYSMEMQSFELYSE
jgi:uncharacterized protein